MTIVVGVDGCKGGWVSVALEDGAFLEATVHADFSSLRARYRDALVIGVDMPIGLTASGPREADLGARKVLGRRASSVFLVPPRAVVEEEDYVAALALASRRGKGISKQMFNLFPKMRELDAYKGEAWLYEVHPEVSFQHASGIALLPPKKTWAGVTARRAALLAHGIVVPDDIGAAGSVPVDDVLDAAIVAWTARRIAAGNARSLPHERTQRDDEREIAIWV